MATPSRSRLGLWSSLAGAVVLLAAAGGWWLGQKQAGPHGGDPRTKPLLAEASRLRQRLDHQEASASEQQRLLELLIALNRKDQAIALLEPLADREPDRWSLRLLLAELRRDQGDRNGAERELRMILSRKPDQVEALQLMTLLKLEQGQGAAAEAQVSQAYRSASQGDAKPEAMGLGLLLAELQQRRGQHVQAQVTYTQLAAQFPQDQRPLLGLALLRHQLGQHKAAQATLAAARQRSRDPAQPDPILDKLAASWGLEPLRAPSPGTSPPRPPAQQPVPTGRPGP
ncbi:MAG: tetratricopeptide repeat protein [Cyanobacteria bacterium]|nr:tetratricopeptide repeat protein [Cyanobacteriota bacterium]